MIYTIRKWRENKNGTGVVLNASAYDDDNDRWKNVKIYVPYTTDDEHPDATTACVKKNKVTGKQLCLIGVKIFDDYIPDPADAPKKKDSEKSGEKGGKKKPAPKKKRDDDGDDDWPDDYDGPLG